MSRLPPSRKKERVRLPRRVRPIQGGACWNCAHAVQDGWVLPIRRRGRAYVGVGRFCGPECAKRYALDRMGARGLECCAMVSELVRMSAGPTARCKTAPPFMALDTFGGPLSYEEYIEGRCEVVQPHVTVEYMMVVD